MTTLTIEINKDEDLSALKEFIVNMGLAYHLEENDKALTDDIKNMLDERYLDYKEGRVKSISAEESKERIKTLIDGNQ